jgi:hypothetical protein
VSRMAREDRRKVTKDIRSIIRKGKESMYKWIVSIGYEPTNGEIKAWQAGFLAGLNQDKD